MWSGVQCDVCECDVCECDVCESDVCESDVCECDVCVESVSDVCVECSVMCVSVMIPSNVRERQYGRSVDGVLMCVRSLRQMCVWSAV